MASARGPVYPMPMRMIIVCMVAVVTQFLLAGCASVKAPEASPRPVLRQPTKPTAEKSVVKPAVSTAEEMPFWELAAVTD